MANILPQSASTIFSSSGPLSGQLLAAVKYYAYDFWEEVGDHRVSTLPLLNGGPWHVLGLTALYLWFVKIAGPKFMKNRKPYDLRGVMLAHNG